MGRGGQAVRRDLLGARRPVQAHGGVRRGHEGPLRETPYSFHGEYYDVENAHLEPKPRVTPRIYAGGESEAGKAAITGYADAYVTHGGTVEELRTKIAEMRRRREDAGREPFEAFGMAAYVIVRETEAEAQAELARITDVQHGGAYESYQDFISKSQLEHVPSLEDYSVSNRGLRPGFVGTPEQVAARIREFEDAGVDTLLLQFSPQLEEMERFGEQVIPLVRPSVRRRPGWAPDGRGRGRLGVRDPADPSWLHGRPGWGANVPPIAQSAAFVYPSGEDAAARFLLDAPGHTYSRVNNPSAAALERRIADLEGGVGALALASGQAATSLAVLGVARAGDHVVSSASLYGATYTLFASTLRDLGISFTFVQDPTDLSEWASAVRPETRAFFGESIPNPRGDVLDFAGVAGVAHEAGCRSSSTTPSRRRGSSARSSTVRTSSCTRRRSTSPATAARSPGSSSTRGSSTGRRTRTSTRS